MCLLFYYSVEQDIVHASQLHLRGRPGQKSVLLEYADGSTLEENQKGAQQWTAALRYLMQQQQKTILLNP